MSQSKPLKKWHLVLFAVILVSAIVFKIYQAMWPKATVQIGGETFKVLVANTLQHQIEGLSNKKDMGAYGGMLFVFSDSGQHAMVMRDMNFPLDIIWLNGNKIVEIAPNLQPEPGRTDAQLTPFFSSQPSNMVLELPAGFMERTGIKIGDTVEITK